MFHKAAVTISIMVRDFLMPVVHLSVSCIDNPCEVQFNAEHSTRFRSSLRTVLISPVRDSYDVQAHIKTNVMNIFSSITKSQGNQ